MSTPTPKPDDLPNEAQREMIADMIHCALKELVVHGREGRSGQAADLAEAFQNFPPETYGVGGFGWQKWQNRLAVYESKYRSAQYSPKYDYVDRLQQIRRLR